MRLPSPVRPLLFIGLGLCALLAGGATKIVQDQCGPFTDVTPAFCPYVTELYYLGITAGTSPTTFSPDDPLTRGQGAVFVAKGLNQSLARSSRRAALGQWWTTVPQWGVGLGVVSGVTAFGNPAFDGQDIWVPSSDGIARVRASDARLLETWTDAHIPGAVLIAMGRVFVADQNPSSLGFFDPAQPPGPVTIVAADLLIQSMAFDGARIWTVNFDGSVSIVTPASSPPWPVTTLTSGFMAPAGIVFDGSNIWVTDSGAQAALKLDAAGAILQTVSLGAVPASPVFDGANLWIPGYSSNGVVSVVRAADGTLLATLTGNGLANPQFAGFDGQRILVASLHQPAESPGIVSLFRAADLAPLTASLTPSQLSTSASPGALCSDGVSFWIVMDTGELVRF